jgi:hypothetical protein
MSALGFGGCFQEKKMLVPVSPGQNAMGQALLVIEDN